MADASLRTAVDDVFNDKPKELMPFENVVAFANQPAIVTAPEVFQEIA